MNGVCFLAYVPQVLAPTLMSGDVVIMDHLAAHNNVASTPRLALPGPREGR